MTQPEPFHPNFIKDPTAHELDVSSNYFFENTPNFPTNPQILKTEEIKPTPLSIKAEHSHHSIPILSPLNPKPILRKDERNKTTSPLNIENTKAFSAVKKDEIIEVYNKSPSFKDSMSISPNSGTGLTKKGRQTRLFKGQIVENDIFEEKEDKKNVPELRKKSLFGKVHNIAVKLAENTYLEIFFNILVFYALFADDFRTIVLPKSADYYMDSITVVCIFVFSSEVLVSIVIRKGYFNSFFFYLDILSTLTLFFDITYVYEQVFYKSA